MGADAADARVAVGLLGPVELGLADGVMAGVAQPRLRVLLGLLAVTGGRVVTAEALVDGVWGEEWSPRREQNLHALVYQLRRRLAALDPGPGPGRGAARLARVGSGYRLVLGPGELDVASFHELAGRGRAAARAGDTTGARDLFGQALGVWRGAALADAAPLCARLAGEAARLEEQRLAVVEERVTCDLALGAHAEVVTELAGLVAEFPLRERLAALLVTALYRCGRRGEALAVFDSTRRVLAGELGLDPGPELAGLQAQVLADDPALSALSPAAAARGRAPAAEVLAAGRGVKAAASRNNLPVPVAGFVGRTNELVELRKLVGRDRLVTIVGTGGSGKTRLAIEVAASWLDESRDGVWFVDLAELSDRTGVAAAVADAIGVRQVPGQAIGELLVDRVVRMQALLVFDNCEHLVDSVAATVERVLEAGAGVRVVATSRQPLRLPGETVWQTPPMAFPVSPDRGSPAELASFDAVRLFIDRAGHLGAEDVSPEDLPVIAEITATLEGLPLAIELAAAQAAQLGLHQLASLLQDRLGLSWLASRTAHARQQTLAATIGWSYDLLTPPLQSALERLSVFCGGFTLEAAAAVTGATGSVIPTVVALAERSLIAADPSARPGQLRRAPVRYRMLETIRQYCAARAASKDGPNGKAAAQDAYSEYFAGLAEQASAALTGRHQGQWLTTLEADHANLVAALAHLLSQPGRAGQALQMIVHLDRFWHGRGHLAECAALLSRGLDAARQNLSPALRCGALNLAGHAIASHDAQAARMYFTQSLQIARAVPDDYHAAGALWGLTRVGYFTGDLDGGSAAGRSAVELARAVGDPVLLGDCLVDFGLVCDPLARAAVYQEALVVTRRCGDRVNTGWSHNNLGDLALRANDLDAARRHLEQARAIFREIGHSSPVPVLNLGWVHLRLGDLASAEAAFTEALHGLEVLHDRFGASCAILALACSAAAHRDWARAACLLGFADRELHRCGGSWSEPERTYRGQALADTERWLGAEFDSCYDSGHAGDHRDLIDLALSPPHHVDANDLGARVEQRLRRPG